MHTFEKIVGLFDQGERVEGDDSFRQRGGGWGYACVEFQSHLNQVHGYLAGVFEFKSRHVLNLEQTVGQKVRVCAEDPPDIDDPSEDNFFNGTVRNVPVS